MKFTKKPITIDAIQFDGTWNGMANITGMFPEMEVEGCMVEEDKVTVPWFGIKTLEGVMKCQHGDYVIKGIKGEFYPCKPDIFEGSYVNAEAGLEVETRDFKFKYTTETIGISVSIPKILIDAFGETLFQECLPSHFTVSPGK